MNILEDSDENDESGVAHEFEGGEPCTVNESIFKVKLRDISFKQFSPRYTPNQFLLEEVEEAKRSQTQYLS